METTLQHCYQQSANSLNWKTIWVNTLLLICLGAGFTLQAQQNNAFEGDLIYTHSGKRILLKLSDINGGYFVGTPSGADTIMRVRHDSVSSFYTDNKVLLKQTFEDFPALAKLYGPNQDFSMVIGKARSEGNWNPDILISKSGIVHRALILGVEKNEVQVKSPVFGADETPYTIGLDSIHRLDYWEEPSPYHKAKHLEVLEPFRDSGVVYLFAEGLVSNQQFASSPLENEIAKYNATTRKLLNKGWIGTAAGFLIGAAAFITTFDGVRGERDWQIVTGASAFAIAGVITGYGLRNAYSAWANHQTTNRLRRLRPLK